LNFQLPRELLPLTVQRARIDIEVSGPVGRLEFLGTKNRKIVSLTTRMDPVGAMSFDVTDADVLSVDEDGGLVLAVSAGDPDRPELTQSQPDVTLGSHPTRPVHKLPDSKVNYWRIESLRLQLWARSTD
jgi:hypothetical protein